MSEQQTAGLSKTLMSWILIMRKTKSCTVCMLISFFCTIPKRASKLDVCRGILAFQSADIFSLCRYTCNSGK